MTGATPTADAHAVSVGPTKPQTIREFERALLSLGFTAREAKAIASGGFRAIHPIEELGEQLDALADAVERYRGIFSKDSSDGSL